MNRKASTGNKTMANHQYLKDLTTPITPEALEKNLQDLIDKCFDGAFRIERWDDPQEDLAAWTFFLTDTDGFQVWLNDERNIEMPHSFAPGNVFHWIQDYIMILLRESYGGTIYDDGVGFEEPLFIDIDSSGINTYKKWWDRCYRCMSRETSIIVWTDLIKELNELPSCFKSLMLLGEE